MTDEHKNDTARLIFEASMTLNKLAWSARELGLDVDLEIVNEGDTNGVQVIVTELVNGELVLYPLPPPQNNGG